MLDSLEPDEHCRSENSKMHLTATVAKLIPIVLFLTLAIFIPLKQCEQRQLHTFPSIGKSGTNLFQFYLVQPFILRFHRI